MWTLSVCWWCNLITGLTGLSVLPENALPRGVYCSCALSSAVSLSISMLVLLCGSVCLSRTLLWGSTDCLICYTQCPEESERRLDSVTQQSCCYLSLFHSLSLLAPGNCCRSKVFRSLHMRSPQRSPTQTHTHKLALHHKYHTRFSAGVMRECEPCYI